MALWYYNKAEDTEAKFQAIEAIKYMITQWLGQQPMNTAVQPKVDVPLSDQEQQDQLLTVNWMQDITQ
jgi:hypothetical protein